VAATGEVWEAEAEEAWCDPGERGGDLRGDSAIPEEFAGDELADLAKVLVGPDP